MTDRPRILLFTGHGKGKTTAALGMVLRAAGHGLRVLVLHFVKCDQAVGECKALQAFETVEQQLVGRGFLPSAKSKKYAEHQAAAAEGWQLLQTRLAETDYDLIVLDEICAAVNHGLLDVQIIVDWLDARPPQQTIVLTGRDAPSDFIERADTVSDILAIKHGYQVGIPAQKGVEM